MTKVCSLAICERLFRARRRNQKYCSRQCRQRAHENSRVRVRLTREQHRRLKRAQARAGRARKRRPDASPHPWASFFKERALWLSRRLSGDRTTELDLTYGSAAVPAACGQSAGGGGGPASGGHRPPLQETEAAA